MAGGVGVQAVCPANLHNIECFLRDSAYREVVENSASFNQKLCAERRLRMPFLDPQTGVAQTHCSLFMSRWQRGPGVREGQLYTYPAARWRKARRQYLSERRWGAWPSSDGGGGDVGPDLDPDTDSKESHAVGQRGTDERDWYLDDMAMDELDDYNEPEPDSDDDYCDENYSSRKRRGSGRSGAGAGGTKGKRTRGGGNEGSRAPDGGDAPTPKRGRGGGGRGRKRAAQTALPYEVPGDADKPFGCETCGARYKTRPGLTYHYSHSHKETAGSAGSDGDSRDSPACPAVPAGNAPPYLSPQTPNLANQEYQDSYVTFLSNPSAGPPQRLRPSAPINPTVDDNSVSGNPSSPAPLTPPSRVDDDTSRSSEPPSSPSATRTAGPSGKPNPSPYCDFCLGDQRENKKTGIPEELVSCSDCGRSGHPTCLQFTDNMIVSVRKYRWQCIECKCCSMCGTSDNDDQLLFCDDCDRGYHMYCLDPPLATPPEGSWSCKLCIEEFHTRK